MPTVRCIMVVALLIAMAPAQAQDLVLLTNGQRINGTLDDQAETRAGWVAIRTDEGILRVRKDLVKGSELGYESRRAQVGDDDLDGLCALAQWCGTKGMKEQELELLTLAIRLPGASDETRARQALLTDELRGPETALALHRAYRDTYNGTDGEVLDRLRELEDAIKDHDTKSLTITTRPESAIQVADGLEAKRWESEDPQWSNPVTVKPVVVDTTEGRNKIISVDFKGPDTTRAGARTQKAAIRLPIRTPVGDKSVLSVWVQNQGDRPVKLALGVKTGDYVFHESLPQPVPTERKWTRLRFDLRGSDFKSEATSWAHKGTAKNLEDVKEFQLLIYNGDSSGTMLIDAIDFAPPEPK